MRDWLAIVVLLFVALAAIVHAAWPRAAELAIDAFVPAAEAAPDASPPAFLVTPCPIGPQNLPMPPDRKT